MSFVARYRKLPVEIDAIQFNGWSNAEAVQRFAIGTIFVPAGAEHRMRYDHEYDHSNVSCELHYRRHRAGFQIQGLYDGTAVYLLKSGELVNRFRQSPGWTVRQIERVDVWIAKHGDALRAQNADLLDPVAVDRG